MKTINIFTGNHHYPRKLSDGLGITDHICFLQEFCRSNKINSMVTSELRPDCHNIIIENFNRNDVDEIISFVNARGEYSILLTEHMFSDAHVIWDNVPLHLRNDYMINAPERFLNLMKLSQNAKFFLHIFNTPNEVDLRSIILAKPIINLDSIALQLKQADLSSLIYDACFFGTRTGYRQSILKGLENRFGGRVKIGSNEDPRLREAIMLQSKYNLHIPIERTWSQHSTMRLFSAARLNRKTIFLNLDDIDIQPLNSPMLEGSVTIIHDFDELAEVFEKPWQGPQLRALQKDEVAQQEQIVELMKVYL